MRNQKRSRAWNRLVILVLVGVAVTVVAQNQEVTEKEYRAQCAEVPVAELTVDAEGMAGQLVTLTGEILVWEERHIDEGVVTHLILAVEDPAMTLPSGLLPVYIVYTGRISSFIYDTITLFGQVYGMDTYESAGVQEVTLPRVTARLIEE